MVQVIKSEIPKELTRIQVAAIKRTYATNKKNYVALGKLEMKLQEIQNEIDELQTMIQLWESPVMEMTGGYTSYEYMQYLGDSEANRFINITNSEIGTFNNNCESGNDNDIEKNFDTNNDNSIKINTSSTTTPSQEEKEGIYHMDNKEELPF